MLEHIETTKLRTIMAITDKKMSPPTVLMIKRGTNTWVAAAMLAPMTSMVNNCQNSLRELSNIFRKDESFL